MVKVRGVLVGATCIASFVACNSISGLGDYHEIDCTGECNGAPDALDDSTPTGDGADAHGETLDGGDTGRPADSSLDGDTGSSSDSIVLGDTTVGDASDTTDTTDTTIAPDTSDAAPVDGSCMGFDAATPVCPGGALCDSFSTGESLTPTWSVDTRGGTATFDLSRFVSSPSSLNFSFPVTGAADAVFLTHSFASSSAFDLQFDVAVNDPGPKATFQILGFVAGATDASTGNDVRFQILSGAWNFYGGSTAFTGATVTEGCWHHVHVWISSPTRLSADVDGVPIGTLDFDPTGSSPQFEFGEFLAADSAPVSYDIDDVVFSVTP